MADLARTGQHLAQLVESSQRLVRSVDGFSGDDWGAPTLLPGWTRAHLVAHLALNGEALTAVLRGEVDHESVPMYESQDARESDIEELSGADHAELRERLLASTVTFPEAAQAIPADVWDRRFERTREGTTLPLHAAPLMRLREVEVHHVDLDVGHSPADWPPGFAEELVDGMVKRQQPEVGYVVRPLDSDRSWEVGPVGDDPAVVTGPVAGLAWWLSGRPPGEQVSGSRGDLPTVGAW